MADANQLRAEQLAYFTAYPMLLAEHFGEHVLIKGHEIVGYFDGFEAAIGAGYERFGSDGFCVQGIPGKVMSEDCRNSSPLTAELAETFRLRMVAEDDELMVDNEFGRG